MFICKYMPLSQLGALRCRPLAARRLALSPSRSPARCAVPLSQPGALRCLIREGLCTHDDYEA
eukprot:6197450-Pleurochrysis_carterae.AAC.1